MELSSYIYAIVEEIIKFIWSLKTCDISYFVPRTDVAARLLNVGVEEYLTYFGCLLM